MYKIIRDEFSNSENTIHRISTNTFITAFSGSAGWRQFIDDIYTNGVGIVEGADYVGVTTYTEARAAEYPPIEDMVIALWEYIVEEREFSTKEIQTLRNSIKQKYPKKDA